MLIMATDNGAPCVGIIFRELLTALQYPKGIYMDAIIIHFPIERSRKVLTIDQHTEASHHAACRDIFDQASSDHAERPEDDRATTAIMMLACAASCPTTMSSARAWLFRERNVRVTDAA